MRTVFFAALVFFAVSCSETKQPEKRNPVGKWQSHVPWDNNTITLDIRSDSSIFFKVKKEFCPGTKFFVSAGKWHIEKDTVLVMEQFTDGRRYQLKDIFPELVNSPDSVNVMSLSMTGKFIVGKEHIYNFDAKGKASTTQYYDRVK